MSPTGSSGPRPIRCCRRSSCWCCWAWRLRVLWSEPGLALAGLALMLLGAPLFALGRRASRAKPLASGRGC